MPRLKVLFGVGMLAGVVSLNMFAYRMLKEQRTTTAHLAVISVQQTMAHAEQTLVRVQQLQQSIARDEQGN